MPRATEFSDRATTEVGLVVTLVYTKFRLVCSLLLRRLRLPAVGKKVSTPEHENQEVQPRFTDLASIRRALTSCWATTLGLCAW